MSCAVAIWKEILNGNFEEVDGVVSSKWTNEKKNIKVATRFTCYQKAKHLTRTQSEETWVDSCKADVRYKAS